MYFQVRAKMKEDTRRVKPEKWNEGSVCAGPNYVKTWRKCCWGPTAEDRVSSIAESMQRNSAKWQVGSCRRLT